MRWKVLLFILFVASGGAAFEPRCEDSFPFEFREGFIWVKVTVPGLPEPLQMILDSGAEVSTLSVETARRLGLKGGRRVTVLGVGSRTTGEWPLRLHGTVGSIAVPNQFLVADLCALQESCQSPVDGLLGADFFWGKVVQIDFTANIVRVLERAPANGEQHCVPIRFRRKIMQVPVSVSGEEQQWVRLDTGCASAVEWVSQSRRGRTWGTKVSVGLAALRIPTARETVHVGTGRFEKIPVGMHERPFFASEGGLLGLGLLRRFEQITIDAKQGQLVLSADTR